MRRMIDRNEWIGPAAVILVAVSCAVSAVEYLLRFLQFL